MSTNESVLIIGASGDPSRYSNKALISLKEHNHRVVLVNPNESSIMGQSVFKDIDAVQSASIKVDTVTMYVNPKVSTDFKDDLITLKPKRVIFNPGSENPELMKALSSAGIKVETACTLVLLNTNQF